MTPDREFTGPWLALVAVACFLVVALTTPLNMLLELLCAMALVTVFGKPFYYSNGWLLQLLPVVLQTSLFALLFLPVHRLFRRKSAAVRGTAIILLTAIYLGLWYGLTALLIVS